MMMIMWEIHLCYLELTKEILEVQKLITFFHAALAQSRRNIRIYHKKINVIGCNAFSEGYSQTKAVVCDMVCVFSPFN